MSQVRKLLKGQNIPKAEEGYKFSLDSQDIYLTDKDLADIDEIMYRYPMQERQFLANATNAIKSGQEAGNRSNNTGTKALFSGLSDKNMTRLEKQSGSFIESAIPTDSYWAKIGLNHFLQAVHTVYNKNHNSAKTEQSKDSNKTKIGTDYVSLDINTDSNGKRYLSSVGNKGALRVQQILDHLRNGDTSTYSMDGWTDEDLSLINQWLDSRALKDGQTKYDAADAYFKQLWANMGQHGYDSNDWYGNGEDLADILNLFKIKLDNSGGNGGSGAVSTDNNLFDEKGNPNPSARDKSGRYIVRKGLQNKGENPNAYYLYQNDFDTTTPYLVTEADWDKFGLNTDELEHLKNAILYQNRFYTEDDFDSMPFDLQQIVNRIRAINVDTDNTGRNRYDKLSPIINWNKESEGYRYYDSDPENYFYTNSNLQTLLGNKQVSLYDATKAYGIDDGSILLAGYDNSNPNGSNAWGFRRPFYIRIDKDGNITSTTLRPGENPIEGLTYNRFADINPFDSNKYFGEKISFGNDDRKYGIYKVVRNTSTRLNTNVYFDYDNNGNLRLWVQKGKELIPVSEKLREKIDAGVTDFSGAELTRGKANINGNWLKRGGKIDYITKLQNAGSIPQPIEYNSKVTNSGTNVEEGHPFDENGEWHFSKLPKADQLEIAAMFNDLAGAIGGWVGPVGSLAGAGLGLVGTGLNTAADIARQRNGWATAGSTLLNAGLDVASAIPELGEVFQIAKLTKTASRIAKNAKLVNWIGKAFNAYGVGLAIEPFKKVLDGKFKDLTTDEMYALANGLRAISGGARTKLQNRGDAQLASEFTKARNNAGMNEVGHSSSKPIAKDVEIKFTQEDINQIHNAGTDAGKVLRQKLINAGADKTKLESNDDALLTRFGFTVTKGADGKITNVSSPEGYTLDTHTRSVARTGAGTNESFKLTKDEIDEILAGNEEAGTRLRNILIRRGADPAKINTDDVKLLREFGFGVTTHTFGKNRGKVSHVSQQDLKSTVENKVNPENQFTKNGWITDLWNGSNRRRDFIDESMGNNELRSQIDALITNDSSRALQRAYARSQFRRGEAPQFSRFGRLRPNISQEDSSSSPGSSSSPNTTQQSRNYVTELYNTQARANRERQSGNPTFTETSTSESNAASTVQTAMKKVYSAPISTDRSADVAAKRASIKKKRDSERVARNIKALQDSKNPMQTLRELSKNDKDLAEQIAEHSDEFQAALNFALDRMPKNKRLWAQYNHQLRRFLNDNDFVIFNKKGGIIKAQPGTKLWESDDWVNPTNNPDAFRQARNIFSQVWGDNSYGDSLPALNDSWHTPTFNDARTAIDDALKNRISSTSTSQQTDSVQRQKMVAGPTNPIPDRTRWLIPGISALGAISNLIQSKKYADEEKAKINDGRYSLQSQPIDLMAYYNPIFERRRQEINQRRMSGLLGSPTNDWTAYNAGLNQLQSQLDTQLGELTTQEAQDKFTRDQTNVQLRNQKFALDTNTANENARMDAYFDMTSHDPKLAQMMRNWQTKENFRMQMLNMINKDINTIYGYKQNKFNMDQSREFDSWLRSHYAAEVEAYSKLDYNQRMQYADLEDYIERTNPNAVEAIRVQKQLMQEQYLDWLRRNGTTFNYGWLSGRTSPETDTYKKGGTLRGKTRYTMEPDERIWVDNNKAAHAAVAKLSENTIKMLLKALK